MTRLYRRSRIWLSLAALILVTGGSLLRADAQGRRGADNFRAPRAVLQYARDRDYHVRHLSLTFAIDALARSAQGVVTHYLTPLRDSLPAVVLDAGANLKIASCRIDGADCPFTHEKDVLTLTPAAPLPGGVEAAVEIRYEMSDGVQNGGANGAGGFHWIEANAAVNGRSMPVKPDASGHLPRPIGFWTQGETGANRTWVPCYDYPNDLCTSETTVTIPDDWIVIGNGKEGLTTRDTAKHTRTTRWTMALPHATYLLSLAGGALDVRKSSWAGVPLYYVVPRGKADLIPASFDDTPRMLQFFSDVLGVKYPWPKYAEDAMFDFGGGMENVSATTLGASALTDRRSGYYTMASVNSHELAHQWFGDLVTCESWGDVWLNESFATYFEQLYIEHSRGKDAFDVDRDNALNTYLREAARYKRSLSTRFYANPDVMFDSHTYPKGGLILHMMRRELGDKAFFKGLHHYLTVNRSTPVNANDLEKAMTVATGRNMEPFFDQWIYKPGNPVLTVNWSYDDAGKAVVVKVKQVQDTADGTPVYTLPLTIGLLRAGGSDHVERRQVTLNAAEQEFRLPADMKPDALLADPDHDLLKELKDVNWTQDELPVVLRYAPTVIDRGKAARRYVEGGVTDAKAAVLVEALRAEPGEEGASTLLGVLSAAKREDLRGLYREQAASPQFGRRNAALDALAHLPRTEEELRLMRTVGISDTEQYRAVEVALGALGAWDAAGNLDVFAHQIRAKSRRDQLAARAVAVLNDAHLDAAAPLLIEAAAAGKAPVVRRAAVSALAHIAPDNAAVHTALLGLLKENSADLQGAVITALKERNDKESASALRSFAAGTADAGLKTAATDAATSLEGK